MISDTLKEKLINYRRDFHKYAESGWTEFRTTSIIVNRLKELGYVILLGPEILHKESIMGRPGDDIINKEMERAVSQGADPALLKETGGYTGAVAILDTKKPGPVIALRFDIDANDVSETKDPAHKPNELNFASVNNNVMHACGHDGHAAIGLGVAELLMENKDKLKGVIKLIFQPAEEGVRGAKAVANSGVIDDVDYIIGGHLGIRLPSGVACPLSKSFLSSTKFDAVFTGKSAHAGIEPNNGKNALLAAAAATVLMHSIPPHRDGPTRLNVGVLNAGVGRNVIAPNALMKVETRGYNNEINKYVYDSAAKIIENTCAMYGIKYEILKMGEAIECSCDEELVKLAEECAKKVEGIKEVTRSGDLGGSEDFTWLMKAVQDRGGKATYLLIGADTKAGHHNEYFDFDEDMLAVAVNLFMEVVYSIE